MDKPLKLVLFFCHLTTVFGKNETILHGWHSEAQDRGTWSILWSCLATIFICTWSCVHLDVPERRQTEWSRRIFRVLWMALAVIVPEYFVAEGLLKLTKARTIRNGIRKRLLASSLKPPKLRLPSQQSPAMGGNCVLDTTQPGSFQETNEWTITHTHFALSRGYYDQNGTILRWTDPDKAAKLVLQVPSESPLSTADLYSRGSADWIKKTLAVFQILWFTIQLLIRYLENLHITAVEILTLAFIFCSLIIYGLCWNQPQNVEYPVMLNLLPDASRGVAAPRERLDSAREESLGKDYALKRKASNKSTVTYASGVEVRSKLTSELADISAPDFSARGTEDLEKGMNNVPLSGDIVEEMSKPDGPGAVDIEKGPREHDRQPPISEHQPRGDHSQGEARKSQPPNATESPTQGTTFLEHDLNFRSKYRWAEKVTIYLGTFTGAAFGAVHCLLWYSKFPTPGEQLAWRICSVGTACMPPLGLVGGSKWFGFLEARIQHGAPLGYGLSALMIWEIVLLCCYVAARGTLVVLSLMALRALPADTFQSADWNNIIPHLGS